MNIKLSDHFTYKKLLRFTFPSIVMMIFTSIYGVIDGFFVSNFAGKTAFASVNFIIPFTMILGTIGSMFGAGGGAIVAKTLGEENAEKANRLFSLFTYASILCGVVITILSQILIRPVAVWLGADGAMLNDCVLYGRIVLLSLTAMMLQMELQSAFVMAEKPQLGLAVTVISGVTNIVLDALFIAVMQWGITGAASATALSQVIGGGISLIYFARPNQSRLRLTKTEFDSSALLSACANGSSEMMGSLSTSLISMLYNFQLMKYVGENGVAAYGVLMYLNMIFLAVFTGFSMGSAPITAFHYGAGNHTELKSLLRKGLVIMGVFSVSMFALSEILARPLSMIFVGYDHDLLELAGRGFIIYSFSFLFAGLAIYGSSFFTALNNGLISALISFLRTVLFQVSAVLVLPLFFDVDGIWMSIVAAEVMSAIITVVFLAAKRSTYHY